MYGEDLRHAQFVLNVIIAGEPMTSLRGRPVDVQGTLDLGCATALFWRINRVSVMCLKNFYRKFHIWRSLQMELVSMRQEYPADKRM
jgi:hypothetical protein